MTKVKSALTHAHTLCLLYSIHKRPLLQYIEYKVLLNPIYPEAFIEFIFNLLKLKALSSAKYMKAVFGEQPGKSSCITEGGGWLALFGNSKFKHKQGMDFASFIASKKILQCHANIPLTYKTTLSGKRIFWGNLMASVNLFSSYYVCFWPFCLLSFLKHIRDVRTKR